MTDLVERLKFKVQDEDTWGPDKLLFVEAATEIERLKADITSQLQTNADLCNENERLRKALEKLEELAAPRCYWFAVEVFTICTEALRGKDD